MKQERGGRGGGRKKAKVSSNQSVVEHVRREVFQTVVETVDANIGGEFRSVLQPPEEEIPLQVAEIDVCISYHHHHHYRVDVVIVIIVISTGFSIRRIKLLSV